MLLRVYSHVTVNEVTEPAIVHTLHVETMASELVDIDENVAAAVARIAGDVSGRAVSRAEVLWAVDSDPGPEEPTETREPMVVSIAIPPGLFAAWTNGQLRDLNAVLTAVYPDSELNITHSHIDNGDRSWAQQLAEEWARRGLTL
jgi:hypothetical protein